MKRAKKIMLLAQMIRDYEYLDNTMYLDRAQADALRMDLFKEIFKLRKELRGKS
jgi:hypothetical protein